MEQDLAENYNLESDEDVVALLSKGLAIEKKHSSDLALYGSIIVNMLKAICSETVDFSSVGFKIEASYFRRLTVPSNRMRYSDEEKEFWNFYRLLNGESSVRILRGMANYGSTYGGSQDPKDCNINLAVPSLSVRKSHGSSAHLVKLEPGFIESSFTALNDAGISIVNLSLDEKSLSPGVKIVENVDPISATVEFQVYGDVDYAFPNINEKKMHLVQNLTHWYNNGILSNEALVYLCNLEIRLKELLITTEKSIKGLKAKQRKNSVTIAREFANISNITSCLKDIELIKLDLLKMNMINSFGLTISDMNHISVDNDVMMEFPNLSLMHENDIATNHVNTEQSCFSSKDLFSLSGLDTLASLKSTWKIREGTTTCFPDNTVPVFVQFMRIIYPAMELYEHSDIHTFRNVDLMVRGSLLLVNDETSFVQTFAEDLSNAMLLDLMTQMVMFKMNGLLCVVSKENIDVYKLLYSEDVHNVVINAIDIVSDISSSNIPTKLTPSICTNRKIFKQLKNPEIFIKIPINIPNFKLVRKQDMWYKNIDKVFIIADGCDEIFKHEMDSFNQIMEANFKETIKKATLVLLNPAQHVLVLVANSIFGKQATHLTDIPIFYARTGKGYKVNYEIKYCVEKCIEKLASHGIKVVCLSGDTAFHQLTHISDDGNSNNIVGMRFEEMKKLKTAPKTFMENLIDLLPLTEEAMKEVSIPFTWTYKSTKYDWSGVLAARFPELGDFEVDEIFKVLNMNPNKNTEYKPSKPVDLHNLDDDENETETKSEIFQVKPILGA